MVAVPEEQNAAKEYRALFAEVNRLRRDHSTLSDQVTHNVLAARLEDEAMLMPFEPLMALAEQAAKKPHLRINTLEDSVVDRIMTGPDLRFIAKVLMRGVLVSAEKGELEAVRTQMSTFRTLAGHGLYDATQLAWLIHVALNAMYLTSINQVARRMSTQPGVLDWADVALGEAPTLPPLLPYLKGEVPHSIVYLEQSRGRTLSDLGFVGFATLFSYFNSPNAKDAYLSTYLQGVLHQVENWPSDESDWQTVSKRTRPEWWDGKWWIAPSLGLPSVRVNGARVGSGSAIGSYQNRLLVGRIGLAVLRYREARGHFPGTLQQASVEIPASAESSLHYWPKDDSFVLRCGMIEF